MQMEFMRITHKIQSSLSSALGGIPGAVCALHPEDVLMAWQLIPPAWRESMYGTVADASAYVANDAFLCEADVATQDQAAASLHHNSVSTIK